MIAQANFGVLIGYLVDDIGFQIYLFTLLQFETD